MKIRRQMGAALVIYYPAVRGELDRENGDGDSGAFSFLILSFMV